MGSKLSKTCTTVKLLIKVKSKEDQEIFMLAVPNRAHKCPFVYIIDVLVIKLDI